MNSYHAKKRSNSILSVQNFPFLKKTLLTDIFNFPPTCNVWNEMA